MANDWQRVKLGDVLGRKGYIRGPFGSALKRGELQSSGMPVYEQQHAIYGTREFRFFIGEEKYRELSRFTVQPHDLIISCSGTLGRVSIIREKDPVGIISQALLILRPDTSLISPVFLFQILSSPAGFHSLVSVSTGSVQVNIAKRSIIESVDLLLPPLPEQRAIAHILGTLDDKIELNRRRNETLESMARALFQDWFVDFGPVRAKMEGREPYLPANLWQFFPDRLNSEGNPEGWAVTALGEATVELRRGISPSYVESGGVRVLNQKCIRNREVSFAPARRHDHSKRMIDGREVLAGDILINSTGVGTLGRVAQIWKVDEPTVVDSHITLVRANTGVVSTYYLGLNMTGREVEIEALGEGSTGQTELSRVRLGSLPILVPTREVLNQFDMQVRPLLGEMLSNTEESVVLAKLRDTLLPKLISGEIRIKDAEHFMERAGA